MTINHALTPIVTDASPIQPRAEIDLEQLNTNYENLSAPEILNDVIHNQFPDRISMISSFGAEAVVMLHLVSEIAPELPIIMLNTGKLFGETLRYRDRLQNMLGLMDVRSIAPAQSDLTAQDPQGTLWAKNTDACCHIRKVLPQARAVHGFDALLTGRKRFQTNERRTMDIIERDQDGRYKINPLANWQLDDLKTYIETHELPRHPLVKDGYLSIGCMPCTERVEVGGDYRSGRWAGKDKEECGIHLNVDGDGI